MASPQQPMRQVATTGFSVMFDNMSQLGRKAQAIAGEFAKMSEENLGAGAKAAERMKDARSIEDVTGIQSDLMRETYECAATHYRKIAQIAASTGPELAQNYGELVSSMSQAGQEAARAGSDFAKRATEQATDIAQKSAETARGVAEGSSRGGRG